VRCEPCDQVSLFWKCAACGRTRKSDESYPLNQVVASLERFTLGDRT